jgi:hypothetical protein
MKLREGSEHEEAEGHGFESARGPEGEGGGGGKEEGGQAGHGEFEAEMPKEGMKEEGEEEGAAGQGDEIGPEGDLKVEAFEEGAEEHPEKIGIAFNRWFARVIAEALAMGEVAGEAKGDEGVVAHEPEAGPEEEEKKLRQGKPSRALAEAGAGRIRSLRFQGL